MGNASNKPHSQVKFVRSNSKTSTQGSKRNKSQPEIDINNNVYDLQSEINNLDANSTEQKYQEYNKLLSNLSHRLQVIRQSTTNKNRHQVINSTIELINKCFRILHAKKNGVLDNGIDQDTVESHSFINASNPASISNQASLRRIQKASMAMKNIETQVYKLKSHLNETIQNHRELKYSFFENETKRLLTELETLLICNDQNLQIKKEQLNKELMDNWRHLKNFQRRSHRPSRNLSISDRMDTTNEVDEVEEKFSVGVLQEIDLRLADLEVKITEIHNNELHDRFSSLETALIDYQNQVKVVNESSAAVTSRKTKSLDLLEKLMRNLKTKKADHDKGVLQQIERDVDTIDAQIRQFGGTAMDDKYRRMDHQLREMLNAVNILDANNKSNVIDSIQKLTKVLHDKAASSNASLDIIAHTTDLEQRWAKVRTLLNNCDVHSRNDLLLVLQRLEALYSSVGRKCSEMRQAADINSEATSGRLSKVPSSAQLTQLAMQPEQIKTLSSVDIFSHIQDIQRRVLEVIDGIKQLHGTRSDPKFGELRQQLLDEQSALNSVDDLGKSSLQSAKSRAAAKLTNAFEALDKKVAQNEAVADVVVRRPQDELQDVVRELARWRKRIDCFSGHHNDAEFVVISNGLQACWGRLKAIDVGGAGGKPLLIGHEQIKEACDKTEQKIFEYLERLDERSIKITPTHV